jgi:RecB family exonuclease
VKILIARMRAQVERLLEREAESETGLRPRLLEASFGEGDDALRPPLRLAGTRIHGQIDRVDVSPDGGEGVVYDYKTGSRVWAAAKLAEEGKLQLQLYARAIRDLWGIEPIGGLYHPLGKRDDPRPRGFVVKGSPATELLDLAKTDRLEPDEVADALDAGVATAERVASEMRRGAIGRRPNGGRCPSFCRFQPICRLERSLGPGEREGEADGGEG